MKISSELLKLNWPFLTSALGIAIYGMFLAIIIPPAKKDRAVLLVVLIAVALSCLFHWVPLLKRVSSGFVIIICALAAALVGALAAPVKGDPYTHPAEEESGTEVGE